MIQERWNDRFLILDMNAGKKFAWLTGLKAGVIPGQADPEKDWENLVVGPEENSMENALETLKELIENKIKG